MGRNKIFTILTVVLACEMVGACTSPPVPDPKDREVRVFNDARLFKRCDGTTLVYRDRDTGGISAIPNSPECE